MAFHQQQRFDKPYHFKQNKQVVISHVHGGNFRVSPNNQAAADGNGAQGGWAQWKVHIENNGLCRLENEKTGKYARIWQKGNNIDVAGGGGQFCYFKIHHMNNSQNTVKLESQKFPGKYIAFKANKTIKIGSGGRMCLLTFWKKQGGGGGFGIRQQHAVKPVKPIVKPQPVVCGVGVGVGGGGFNSPYHFKQNKRVIIRGPHGGHIRVRPNDTQEVDCTGGFGEFAQWDATIEQGGLVRFRSVKTGKYLRIAKDGQVCNAGGKGGALCYFRVHLMQGSGVFKLENNKYVGRFVAVRPNSNPTAGPGGKHCVLTFFKQGPAVPQVVQQPLVNRNNNKNNNNNNNKPKFDKPYLFKHNKRVVIGGPHGKHLRVSPQNRSFADGSGGHGSYAQWEIMLSGGNLVQLKSCKTGDYLRIHDNGNRIDVGGKGGKFTFFKFHIQHKNVVKLQSNIFPRSWVAIPKDHNVTVGRGGPHCALTFWRGGGGGGNNNNKNNNNNNNAGFGLAEALTGAASAMMQATIAQNQRIIAEQQRMIDEQNRQIEGQMANMNISGDTANGSNDNYNGNYSNDSNNTGGGTRVCPLCGGKGYYGTFGWCDASSIHKKGPCQLCSSSGYVENCNWIQCNQCNGKGGMGTFGACDRWDIHFKHSCNGCSGYGYSKSY